MIRTNSLVVIGHRQGLFGTSCKPEAVLDGRNGPLSRAHAAKAVIDFRSLEVLMENDANAVHSDVGRVLCARSAATIAKSTRPGGNRPRFLGYRSADAALLVALGPRSVFMDMKTDTC